MINLTCRCGLEMKFIGGASSICSCGRLAIVGNQTEPIWLITEDIAQHEYLSKEDFNRALDDLRYEFSNRDHSHDYAANRHPHRFAEEHHYHYKNDIHDLRR